MHKGQARFLNGEISGTVGSGEVPVVRAAVQVSTVSCRDGVAGHEDQAEAEESFFEAPILGHRRTSWKWKPWREGKQELGAVAIDQGFEL